MKQKLIGQFVARDEEWRSYRVHVHQCEACETDPEWLVQFICAPLQLVTEDGEKVSRLPHDKPGVFWIERKDERIRIVADQFRSSTAPDHDREQPRQEQEQEVGQQHEVRPG